LRASRTALVGAVLVARISWAHEPAPEEDTSSTAREVDGGDFHPLRHQFASAWRQTKVGARCGLVSAPGAKRIERSIAS
jgi:hypothetical protein